MSSRGFRKYKILVVGDGLVGKSSVCKSYANRKTYKLPYQPTVSETHEITVLLDNIQHHVVLWDTAGLDEWKQLRKNDYIGTDCFIIAYSVENFTSYENVRDKWISEVRAVCPKTPIVLLGTKMDLRTPSNFVISREQGQWLQSIIKADAFAECSYTSLSSIECVFLLALSSIVGNGWRKRRCCIL